MTTKNEKAVEAKVKAAPVKVKVKAKAATGPKLSLEVRTDVTPTKVYGNVLRTDQNYRIDVKRPYSGKIDTFVLTDSDVHAAMLGEKGWLLTDHQDFKPFALNMTLDEAKVGETEISGVDRESGNTVVINRVLTPTTHRFVSYAE